MQVRYPSTVIVELETTRGIFIVMLQDLHDALSNEPNVFRDLGTCIPVSSVIYAENFSLHLRNLMEFGEAVFDLIEYSAFIPQPEKERFACFADIFRDMKDPADTVLNLLDWDSFHSKA